MGEALTVRLLSTPGHSRGGFPRVRCAGALGRVEAAFAAPSNPPGRSCGSFPHGFLRPLREGTG